MARTLAEQNWLEDIAREIRRRIDFGPYVSENHKTPYYVHTIEDPFDPDKLTKRQLETYLREVEGDSTQPVAVYGALFRIPNPHAK
ncbi:hypothetical protein GS876_20930 [Rhodococcus hoagii]|nr:hypothetical protein [Prescottella equi]MBM4516574.1 hypothetical protein [Prescottella equi]MBM4685600.1 hypothetical protein [Prescottella equi]NKU31554.1 hypothetical protein [Prescottella equi]NKU37717.1 hypothetical protein [Prescottella equi]